MEGPLGVEDRDASVAAVEASVSHGEPSRSPAQSRPKRWHLALLVGAFAVAYAVAALLQRVPTYVPDEPTYVHLARSLAHGHGFTWRGEPQHLRAALYVYLLTPVYWVFSGVTAYDVAKLEAVAFAMSLALPVWWLAREMLPRRLALLTLALSLAGTWMALSTSLMTENLALPLATAALVSTVRALRDGASRSYWLALLLAVLATWARLQVVVIFPAMLAALLLDIARAGRLWRVRARIFRGPLAAMGAVVALVALAAVVRGSAVTGDYSGVLHYVIPLRTVAATAGQELIQLAAMSGVLPLLLLGGLALRRRAWRDEAVGPLLCVLVPLVIVLAAQNGWYVSGTFGLWPIQRYMSYAAPLLVIALVVALQRPGVVNLRVVATAALLAVPLLSAQDVRERSEQRALFATTARVHDVLGGASDGQALLAVALVLCLIAGGVLLRRRGRGAVGSAGVIGGIVLVLLVAQTATSVIWQHNVAADAARGTLSHDLAWVDHHRHGSVSVLEFNQNSNDFMLVDFFNDGIDRYYARQQPVDGTPLKGGTCRWSLDQHGNVHFPSSCQPKGDQYLINDPTMNATFYNEGPSVEDPNVGRLVTVRGPLRLRSMVSPPCNKAMSLVEPITLEALPADAPVPCRSGMTVILWLRKPAILDVGIVGAPLGQHTVTVGGQKYQVPVGDRLDLRLPVKAGTREVRIGMDWKARAPQLPFVDSVVLEQDGQRLWLL